MRAPIYRCLVAFVLLVSGLCAVAEGQPAAPWLNQFITRPGDNNGPMLTPPRVPATGEDVITGRTCYRIVKLTHCGANELLPLFTPPAGMNPGTEWGVRPFLPYGAFVSRAGDDALLITAGSEENLNQLEGLVKLFDQSTPRALLEVMLVETTKFFPLPAANPDDRINGPGGGGMMPPPTMMEALVPFLHQPDTIVYRTFLDIPSDQQGVLDLSAYPLPVKGILFGRIHVHPDNSITLPIIPLIKGDQVEQELFMSVYKERSMLLLNALLTALKPEEDPAGKARYFYLLVGVNICRDDRVHLADGARPLRLFYDGRKKPLIIPLQHTSIETLLPQGVWLEDTVTPPKSWPQQELPSFAASPSMNALLAVGDERQRAALQKLIPSIDFPQPKLQVEGQFFRIGEKDLRELGLRQTRSGEWQLPYSDAGLSRKIALSLVNSKAKLITMPRMMVQPFGAGSVEEYGWGIQVDQAYTRRDGSISLQVSPVFPRADMPGEKNAKIITLELCADQSVIAGVYPLGTHNTGEYPLGTQDSDDLLLFVVKAAPVDEGVSSVEDQVLSMEERVRQLFK